MRSLTIEDMNVGDSASSSKTVTEADVWAFAGISGDFNPVHVDAEFAKRSKFGARVAHGPLTLALVAGVTGTQLPGVGAIGLGVELEFKLPVYIGDTITSRVEVAEIDRERNVVRLALTATNQRGELVAVGSARLNPARKPALQLEGVGAHLRT